MFSHENVIESFANHVYNRSISENFVKLMQTEKLPAEISTELANKRKERGIQTLFRNFQSGSQNIELYLNTTYIIGELSVKKYIFNMLISTDIFTSILSNLSSEDNQKVVSTCKIISIILAQLKEQIAQANKPGKKDSEDFLDNDDDVMLDDETDHTEKQSQEVESLSQNPLILLASEKIPSLVA